ncbi:hypothetical protein DPMN_109483 [Dreissena polymorpha]|uniref:Uncharacterized protein n=1 Tax=Dreissena polymorpha TaxID=45954 RepID=A0A9D4QM15_DREPO|nr:hypothetical protein DPMN_109483 [Dreissena polymorpha]
MKSAKALPRYGSRHKSAGRTDRRKDGKTDNAKTISLRLWQGITKAKQLLGELQELYFSIYDQREAAGFILPCNSFKKDHIPLLQSALVSNMVLDCRDEMDQFIEGNGYNYYSVY